MYKNVSINSKRLYSRLTELGKIGRTDKGGITRFSFTEEDKKAKILIKSYMSEADLNIYEDAFGNVIGEKIGTDTNAPFILTGSHLDTVIEGGAFDGALGIIAAIEVLTVMKENNIKNRHTIKMIAFADEEGVRFGRSMTGSSVITGKFSSEYLSYKDKEDISIEKALKDYGYSPENLNTAIMDAEKIKCLVELHIEQASVLESENLPVGIVSGIAGPLWQKYTLKGQSGHAGATPMRLRRDPLVCASTLMQKIVDETSKRASTVGTVGTLNIEPGGINIIPSQVELTLDLRDVNIKDRDEVEKVLKTFTEKVNDEGQINIKIEDLYRTDPVLCSEKIITAIKEAFYSIGLKEYSLMSGAGHDSMQFADICPIGMIFVRSIKGISHNKEEYSTEEDCALGAEVLYKTLLLLDAD